MRSLPCFLLFSMGLFLVHCTSTHTQLLQVQKGQNKRQVLSRFGEPGEKYRKQGKDHWVFESISKAKQSPEKLLYKHTLVFEEGIMVDKHYSRSFTKKELHEHFKGSSSNSY